MICWLGGFDAHPLVIVIAPIAPVYAGVDFLLRGDLDMAIVSLVVSVLTIGLGALSVAKANRAAGGIAMVLIIVYWLWSFMLIGIGV